MIDETFSSINVVPSRTNFGDEEISTGVFLMWENGIIAGLLSAQHILIPSDQEWREEEFSTIEQSTGATFEAEEVDTVGSPATSVYFLFPHESGSPSVDGTIAGLLSAHFFLWSEEGLGGDYVEAIGVIGFAEEGPGYTPPAAKWRAYFG